MRCQGPQCQGDDAEGRRKRTEIDYDRAFVASETDAEEIIVRACKLQRAVEDWIAKHHPTLAK